MVPRKVQAQIDRLDKSAHARFTKRGPQRKKKLDEIDKRGVFNAAGTENAVGRAAHLTVAEGRTLEAIIGTNDSDHVNFLSRGLRAVRSVCRLLDGPDAIGSGFLVGPGLLLTNNHVIADESQAARFIAEFDFELDADDQPRRPVRFALDPDRMFATSASDELDFTFVAVRPTGGSDQRIESFGWLPMDARTNKILEGEPIVIIQHPQGREKQICVFNSELVDRVDDFLHYTTDTEPGSSGSPTFNRGWQLVALHHASTRLASTHRGRPIIANEGVRVSVILDSLRTGKRVRGAASEVLATLSAPAVLGNGRPTAPDPAPGRSAARPSLEARATVIRRRDPRHYAGRAGFDVGFLGNGSLRVPLPGMPDWMIQDTSRLLSDRRRYELRYQHFTVVMSISRRLPIFTAVNIDGRSIERIGRKDRDPNRVPEALDLEAAADIWFYDPRIAEEHQLGPEVYDETDFAFGHVVRRLDPVWGTARDKRIANDDTFHMTNCAPQHKDFNSGIWQKLENAMLDGAEKNKRRFSLFNGPVFNAGDPDVLDVPVPTEFWKVVAYAENGKLRARGFVQSQVKFVDQIIAALEALPQLDRVVEYQVPIRDIARATSLDFGPLIAADELKNERRRRLNESLIEEMFA